MRLLTVAPFIAVGEDSILTVVRGAPTSEPGFVPLDASVAPSSDVELARFNAESVGIAHLWRRQSQCAPTKAEVERKVPKRRVVVLRSGERFIEVAFFMDLDRDLHAPGEACFESYEVLPAELLLTPDVFIEPSDAPGVLVCAFARAPDNNKRAPISSVRVTCHGRPGETTHAEYPLDVSA